MKKVLLGIICLLLLFPLSIGNSAEGGKVDGYDWAQMSRERKLGFVMGWIKGGEVMTGEIPFAYITYFFFPKHSRKVITTGIPSYPTIKEIAEGASTEMGIELYDLAIGQIVDVIDKVFSDPRVKTWEIHEVMPLVRGRLKEGWTEKDLDGVIAYMIKEKDRLKKWVNFDSLSQSEREKLEKETRQLEEPKVLKALRAYRLE